MNTSVNHALRLITLWIAWLLAMLFHVDLGLMPLFHGQSPEIHSHVQEGALLLLVLMVALTVFGLMINVEAWRWWRQAP